MARARAHAHLPSSPHPSAASDTHLGHDVGPKNGSAVTSYTKNTWAIQEMNALPGRGGAADAWPAALGGGPVAAPRGVTVSGDLIDDGNDPARAVNGCNQWANFTALYGLNGTDGLLKYRVYEGRGNQCVHRAARARCRPKLRP